MSDMTPEKAQALLDGATPGPWKVCETTIHGVNYGGCWVEGPDVDDGDGMPHGIFIPMTGSGGAMSYTTRLVDIQCHDHNDANARLIAPAPDLARAYIAQAARIADLTRQLAEARDKALEEAALIATRAAAYHRVTAAAQGPGWGIEERMAEASEALERSIRNLKGQP